MSRRITDPRIVPKHGKNLLQIAQEQREADERRRKYINTIIGIAATIGAVFFMKSYFDKSEDNSHKAEIYNEFSK